MIRNLSQIRIVQVVPTCEKLLSVRTNSQIFPLTFSICISAKTPLGRKKKYCNQANFIIFDFSERFLLTYRLLVADERLYKWPGCFFGLIDIVGFHWVVVDSLQLWCFVGDVSSIVLDSTSLMVSQISAIFSTYQDDLSPIVVYLNRKLSNNLRF